MPRYYFDVRDGLQITDNVGRDLQDIAAAKMNAMYIATVHSTNSEMIGANGGAIVIVIREPKETTVATVRFVFSIQFEDDNTRS